MPPNESRMQGKVGNKPTLREQNKTKIFKSEIAAGDPNTVSSNTENGVPNVQKPSALRVHFAAAASLFLVGAACTGGQTSVVDPTLCQGPYCDQLCSTNSECPSDASCVFGRCSTGDGSSNGLGNDNGDNTNGGGSGNGNDNGSDNNNDNSNGNVGNNNNNGGLGGGPGNNNDNTNTNTNSNSNDNNTTCDPGNAEICNYFDDNCDGNVDEGVLNLCDNCEGYPTCVTGTDPGDGTNPSGSNDGGTDTGNLPAPSPEDGTVLLDEDMNGYGSVTLPEGTTATDFAWPSSDDRGTTSRVDTVLHVEVGRYASVLVRDDDPAKPWVADWAYRSQCQQPSRSTIDEFGNAYVANRAVGGYGGTCDNRSSAPNEYGSVTKFGYYDEELCNGNLNAGLEGCQCEDRDGDGFIWTSRDYDDPKNGIEVDRCSGGDCDDACTTDFDCDSGRWCVRDLFPTETLGRCSNTPPNVAPCTGDNCAQLCDDSTPCPAEHHCVLDANDPTQHICSDRPQTPEFLGKDDECVLWTRRIPGDDYCNSDSDCGNVGPGDNGARTARPRAMAIDRSGFIWVGDDRKDNVFKLSPEGEFVDPVTGDVCPVFSKNVASNTLRTIPWSCRIQTNAQPYGAVADSGKGHPDGFSYAWFTETDGDLQRIDTRTGYKFAKTHRAGAYGITIDEKDRIWTPDRGKDSIPEIHRYTPGDPCTSSADPAYCESIECIDNSACPGSTVCLVDQLCGCQTDSQCPGGHTCVAGHCTESVGSGSWDTFSPIDCVGPFCDEACTSDSDCNGFGGSTKCRASRCTVECSSNSDCQSVLPGSLCNDNGCTWDGTNEWRGRGATTELRDDGTARVWSVFNDDWVGTPNWIFVFDSETGAEFVELRRRVDVGAQCNGPVGVGIGFGNILWMVSQNDSHMCGLPMDDTTGTLIEVEIDRSPYTYSDFTGNLFRSFTAPKGVYKSLLIGCPFGYRVKAWSNAVWTADTPGESELEVRFRFGATIGQARNPANPALGPVLQSTAEPTGTYALPSNETRKYLQVEFTFLRDDNDNAPVLHTLDVGRMCEPDPDG